MAQAPISPARANRRPWSAADPGPQRGARRRLALLAALLLVAGPAQAQAPTTAAPTTPVAPASAPDPIFAAQRAANLARMQAERLNGGLGSYRTQDCMHRIRGGDCLIRRDGSGFLFRFLGGAPGWQQLGLPPTHETEILVSRDGTRVEQVVYNGPPRPGSTTAP